MNSVDSNPCRFRTSVDAMTRAFREVSGRRGERSPFPDSDGPGWIVEERYAMLREVQWQLASAGADTAAVTIDDIAAAQDLCVGHSDYGHKFALGCAELVRDRLDAVGPR